MRVEILGTGCARCQRLAGEVQATLERLGSHADIRKIEDLSRIMSYGVTSTPALVVDGRVRMAGRVPGPAELEEYLRPERGSGTG